MPIDRHDFDGLNESDIEELFNTGVPEGLRVEYKRDLYGGADLEKKEALKDISALANSEGGHLVIGVDAPHGLPIAIPGVVAENPEEIVVRLEQLVRTGIEPRLVGVRTRAVQLRSGRYCIVMRVPKSWMSPHRVNAYGTNRYWIRNSNGVHEASVEELRNLFLAGATALDRMRAFRAERVRFVCSGTGPSPLAGGGRLFVHVMPYSAFLGAPLLNLKDVERIQDVFRPIGALGVTSRFNIDGFVNYRGGPKNHGYTQIFRNGVLEATKAAIVSERNGFRYIAAATFEAQFFETLPGFFRGLHQLGVPAPLCVFVTLEGTEGVSYTVRQIIDEDIERPLNGNELVLPECIVDEYGDISLYSKKLRPIFDALWNASGYADAKTFNDAGDWTGKP